MSKKLVRFPAVHRPRERRAIATAFGIAVVAGLISVPAFATGQGGGDAARTAQQARAKHQDRAQDITLIRQQAAKLRGPKGAAGATGATGAAGPIGAQGPPGPTASAAATNTPGPITLTSSNLGVLSLGGVGGTGVIRPPFSGRLLVSASATFRKTDAAGESTVDCFLVMSLNGARFGSTFPGETAISQAVNRGFSRQFEEESLAVVGSAPVVAGNTYDVTLVCQSFSPSIDYAFGNMTALVAGG